MTDLKYIGRRNDNDEQVEFRVHIIHKKYYYCPGCGIKNSISNDRVLKCYRCKLEIHGNYK